MNNLTTLAWPVKEIWGLPLPTASPPSPFETEWLTSMYHYFLQGQVPVTIATVYFVSVHLCNSVVRKRQIKQAQAKDKNFVASTKTEKELKRLPAAPFWFAKTATFKFLVLLHNIFLCVYSAWTFVGMLSTIANVIHNYLPGYFNIDLSPYPKTSVFWQAICNVEQGILTTTVPKNLSFYGFWFYMSKFYEVLDTIIILLKGKPSSLLQSYHHSGAMLCMWSGVRYQSSPIWIFVVFNSFIHTLMYLYYTLCCLHIRVPTLFKRSLTALQIFQFVFGGSLGLFHFFIQYQDLGLKDGTYIPCITSPNQAAAIFVNVSYLTPLTALFGAFYIESYLTRQKPVVKTKKTN
ncbi:hypothetical protein BABINDRAFT_161971 [Babjeviella inositovora NRRL Y-12698]|uniref:Elongation of fatty acids protein n=1 Tax=Babjeviella inositovora NRRL Y-12698 TaxID=984486 RepID=A0A1E3QPF0_9ASCO|nr:uncharacterized protein BABINDRAFT_161971 [Babjeviella inositovora NRRL Y-12698]ODQ79586.1 hypothetical protein BABINDRAFT_161971 [Babjeviella inositovora NRRL Y-12698]